MSNHRIRPDDVNVLEAIREYWPRATFPSRVNAFTDRRNANFDRDQRVSASLYENGTRFISRRGQYAYVNDQDTFESGFWTFLDIEDYTNVPPNHYAFATSFNDLLRPFTEPWDAGRLRVASRGEEPAHVLLYASRHSNTMLRCADAGPALGHGECGNHHCPDCEIEATTLAYDFHCLGIWPSAKVGYNFY